jgi:hypothetical protein
MFHLSSFVTGVPSRAREQLDAAARLWNVAHPSDAGGSRSHRVSFLPDEEVANQRVSDGTTIILPRFFFGELRRPRAGKVTVRVVPVIPPPNGRAFFDSGSKLIVLVPSDVESANTLAHELGHAVNLPDEYSEPLRGTHLPSIVQVKSGNTRVRPFERDNGAMMKGSQSPRARYYWHLAHELNTNPALHPHVGSVVVPTKRYDPYKLPTAPPLRAGDNPWIAKGEHRTRGSMATAFLFRVSQDQGTKVYIWDQAVASQGPSGKVPFPVDGIMVVQVKVLFRGLRDQHRKAAAHRLFRTTAADAWLAHAFRPMFIVSTDPDALLQRIGLDFRFYFATSAAHTAGIPPDLTIHLLPDSSSHAPTVLGKRPGARVRTIALRTRDMTGAVLRYALDVPTERGGELRRERLQREDVVASSLVDDVKALLGEAPSVPRHVAQMDANGFVEP